MPNFLNGARPHRDTSRDGLRNKVLYKVLTSARPFWSFVQRVPPAESLVNKSLINLAIYRGPLRPSPWSTQADYTSWASLTDRTYFARYLPPAAPRAEPPVERVAELFKRADGTQRLSSKSTTLFAHFAQWFTDSFLRSERQNPKEIKNTSNHEIDLCAIYGLNALQTEALRARRGGRLKSQLIGEEEFPPFYYDEQGNGKAEFAALPEPMFPGKPTPEQASRLFATGVERANVTTGFAMMNTLFLREHNRVAGELAKSHPTWDDERLFQTTRNVLIVMLLKIVVEDYINHITPYHFQFRLSPGRPLKERWCRTNWVALEFNLLYRWHSLVPDRIWFGDTEVAGAETGFANHLLIEHGLQAAFAGASRHRAGEIGLFNTPPYLVDRTEKPSIELARKARLASYNEYRTRFNFPRVTHVNQISSRPEVRDALTAVYRSVDDIELYVGLFAEDPRPNSVLAPLMGRMVGCDAFSQALTNPLISDCVYSPEAFSSRGKDIIDETRTLNDVYRRNTAGAFNEDVSFTYSGQR
jgi:prostaglandin-endoperoxide synthase 2